MIFYMGNLSESALGRYRTLRQSHQGTPSAEPQQSESTPQAPDWRYRRTAFINEMPGPRQELNSRGQPTTRETPGYVEFSPEVVTKMSNFLGSYADRLKTIQSSNSSLWESDIMSQNREVLAKLVDSSGEPSVASIESFLDSSAGKLQAERLMARQAELIYNAMGKRVDYVPGKTSKSGATQLGDVALDVGRGFLRKVDDLVHDSDYKKKAAAGIALTGATVLGGAVGGGVLGGATALAVVGATAIRHSFRPGEAIRVINEPVVYQRIKENPELKAYVEAMTGLSVDKFTVDATTHTVIPPTAEVDRALIKRAESSAFQNLATVSEFNRALGADASTGRQFLFRNEFSSEAAGPQHKLAEETQRRFKEKLKKQPDRWGQKSDHPCYLKENCAVGSRVYINAEVVVAPGTPGETAINTARTNAQKAALDARVARGEPRNVNNEVRQAADRAAEAERERLINAELGRLTENKELKEDNYFDRLNRDVFEKQQIEMLTLYDQAEMEAAAAITAQKIQAKQVAEEQKSLGTDMAYIGSKRDALGPQGELTKKQKDEYQERQKEVSKNIEVVEKDEAVYTALNDSKKTADAAVQAFHENYPFDAAPADALARLKKDLDPSVAGSLADRRKQLFDAKQRELTAVHGTVPTTLRRDDYNAEIARATNIVNNRFKDQEDYLEGETKKVNDQIKDVETKQAAITTTQKEQIQSDALKNIEELQEALVKSFDEVVGWGPIVDPLTGAIKNPGITQVDLATLSYEDLVEKINTLYSEDDTKLRGWAKELNDDPSKKEKLLHAMLEARGLSEENKKTLPGSAFETAYERYDSLVGTNGLWNLSDGQLRSLSRDELRNILTEKARRFSPAVGPAVPPPGDEIIDGAKAYAQEKIGIRESVTKNLKAELNRERESARVSEGSVDNTEKTERISEITRIISRATAEESIFDTTPITHEFVEYAKTDVLPAKGSSREHEYTDEERAYSAPEGYYKWLQFITNYQHDESIPDRQEAFRKAEKLIPKKLLAGIMNESLAIGLVGAEAENIDRVLEVLKTRGSITEDQAYLVVRGVVSRLNQEAKTSI